MKRGKGIDLVCRSDTAGMSRSRSHYQADPSLADRPLALEEVQEVLAADGRGFVKDSEKVLHLVRRTAATIEAFQETVRTLHREVEQTQIRMRASAGTPTSLHPKDSFKFLTADQKAEAVEGHMRSRLKAVEQTYVQAQQVRQQANQDLSAAQYVLATLQEDPAIDPDTREKVAQLLENLPEEKAQVAPPPTPHTPPPPPDTPPSDSTDGGESRVGGEGQLDDLTKLF